MGAATPAAHAVDVAAVEGAELTPEGLFDFFTQQIPYYAIPRYVELAGEIPIGLVGRCTSASRVTRVNRPGFGRHPIHHLCGG
jgi:hypothetical protein